MTTKQMTRNALFLALIIITGFISIPVPGLPVPIVLQNMTIMMAGFFLGRKNGFLTVLTFLLLVFIGLPILAGGRGGAMIFVGPSGGYLLGYLLSPIIVGTLVEKVTKINFVTLVLIYFFGSALVIDFFGGFSIAFAGNISVISGLKASASFIPIDLIKVVLGAFISDRLYKYNVIGPVDAR